jgi:hypothetical protein
MIDLVLFQYILNNLTFSSSTSFRFGSAEGQTPPYIVMFKVDDLERPETLCQDQGDSGRALFQFSGYGGGNSGTATNAGGVVQLLEALKVQVATILGEIGSAPDDYRIWSNQTGGVRLIGSGAQSLFTWGAFFESDIWWEKI